MLPRKKEGNSGCCKMQRSPPTTNHSQKSPLLSPSSSNTEPPKVASLSTYANMEERRNEVGGPK